jgi:hypothetical protein
LGCREKAGGLTVVIIPAERWQDGDRNLERNLLLVT